MNGTGETPRWNTGVFLILTALLPLTVLLYGAVHPISLVLVYSLIGATALITFTAKLLQSNTNLRVDGLSLPLFLIAAYCLLQIVPFGSGTVEGTGVTFRETISVDVFWTMLSGVHFFSMGLFFILMQSMLGVGDRVKRFETAFIVLSIGYAFFAILQFIISPGKIYGVYEVVGASPFGSFVNRHNFAAIIEMAIAIPLAMILSGNLEKDRKFLFLVLSAALGVALLMSGSRGGLVAFVCMVVLMLILVQRKKGGSRRSFGRQVVLIAVLFAGLIGGIAFVGGENTFSRVASTVKSEDFSTNRIEIWDVTLDVIVEHMPFGAGFGAFRTAYAPHDPTNGLQRVEQAHNDYLQVVADGGLPGAAIGFIFLMFLFRTAKRALRVRDRLLRNLALGVSCGIFAVLVHSIFDFVLHTTAVALVFLSQVAVLSVIAARQTTEGETSSGPDSHIVEFGKIQT
jgi:O-antigen ligase